MAKDGRTLSIGFLMDPLERLLIHHDSTFALMLEAQARGHRVFSFEQRHLSATGAGARARMREVRVAREEGRHFQVVSEELRPLTALDVLFLRKDPPVDVPFLHATQLVELGAGGRPLLINDPRGLRDANEKLFALRFPALVPETLVSSDRVELREFIAAQPAGAIVKPVDGFGGRAVVRVVAGDPNQNALLELMTAEGTQLVVAQRYLEAAAQGDERIILLDGEPIGALLRVPRRGDLRCNLAVGGKAVKARLGERERELCAAIGPALRAHGLLLAGIDVIGGKLIEVNVTSPTGLVEIDALDGVRLEAEIIEFAERRVRG